MRKLISILVCLWVAVCAYAICYPTARYTAPPSSFGTTSGYLGARTHHATFDNRESRIESQYGLTAISAANFQALNSEGGACYQPSGAPGVRKGRPGDPDDGSGGGAIGEYDFHSPVGDTPWMLVLLLAVIYGIRKKKKVLD